MVSSSTPTRSREDVLHELAATEARVEALRLELASLPPSPPSPQPPSTSSATAASSLPMSLREYQRYGRQMILPSVGLEGQLKLRNAHILVIGAGGLGCPVLLFLAAAGVGEITILDHDSVELSNLHRQVLHTEGRIGVNKAESAKIGLEALNSDITIHAHTHAFTPSIFHSTHPLRSLLVDTPFSLILDCTDNPATRHFLNSYSSARGIPLVSGGAVRTDGTVGVFSLPLAATTTEPSSPTRGPCYACVFPPTPKAEVQETEPSQLELDLAAERAALQGTGACSDEGVLGVLCGAVGVQMAAESIRVLLGIAKPTLHLLAPLSATPLRTIKLRPQKPTCPACSNAADKWSTFVSRGHGEWDDWDDPLCAIAGVGAAPLREGERRVKVGELSEVLKGARIVDVRPKAEFGICSIEGSVNIPFSTLLKDPSSALDPLSPSSPVYFLCRRGNDSRLAARALGRHLQAKGEEREVVDVVGGLTAWGRDVDPMFPVY